MCRVILSRSNAGFGHQQYGAERTENILISSSSSSSSSSSRRRRRSAGGSSVEVVVVVVVAVVVRSDTRNGNLPMLMVMP